MRRTYNTAPTGEMKNAQQKLSQKTQERRLRVRNRTKRRWENDIKMIKVRK